MKRVFTPCPSVSLSEFFSPSAWGFHGAGTTFLTLIALLALLLVSSPAAAGEDAYVIELGDVIVLPGDTEAVVPLYLTSPEPIQSWQLTLEYDVGLLILETVEIGGTVSEALDPEIVVEPQMPPIFGVKLNYSPEAHFPAGDRLLAAFLHFSVLIPGSTPPGGFVDTDIQITGSEPFPVRFMLADGGSTIPQVVPGEVIIYFAPLIRAEHVETSFLELPVEVPVALWTEGPVTSLAMGLDFDDFWLLTGVNLEGTVFDGTDVTVTTTVTGYGMLVEIRLATGSLPALDGAVVAKLVFGTEQQARTGMFPINWAPEDTFVNLEQIDNLLPGSIHIRNYFLRGDPNFDGTINLADGTYMLENLFQAGEALVCPDAGDLNDDSVVDLSDVVFLLNFLFDGALPPCAPFPDIGEDPTINDALPCLP